MASYVHQAGVTYLHKYQEADDTETEAEQHYWNVQLPSTLHGRTIVCVEGPIYEQRELLGPTLQNDSISTQNKWTDFLQTFAKRDVEIIK